MFVQNITTPNKYKCYKPISFKIMKYVFEMSSQVNLLMPVEQKHQKVIEGLKTIKSPWGIPEGLYPMPEFGSWLTAFFRVNKIFGNGIKGDFMYSYRRSIKKFDDDRAFFKFNVKKTDYQELVEKIFKKYIDFFDADEAKIYDEPISHYDYDRFHADINKLNSFRFYPVGFWSERVCMEVLGISLLDLKNKISDYAAHVEFYNNGIIILASYKPLNLEEANAFDFKLKSIVASHLVGVPFIQS